MGGCEWTSVPIPREIRALKSLPIDVLLSHVPDLSESRGTPHATSAPKLRGFTYALIIPVRSQRQHLNPGPAGPQVESGGSGHPWPSEPGFELILDAVNLQRCCCYSRSAWSASELETVASKPISSSLEQFKFLAAAGNGPWKSTGCRNSARPIRVCIDDSPMAYKNHK
jgi:hypothetical protein